MIYVYYINVTIDTKRLYVDNNVHYKKLNLIITYLHYNLLPCTTNQTHSVLLLYSKVDLISYLLKFNTRN